MSADSSVREAGIELGNQPTNRHKRRAFRKLLTDHHKRERRSQEIHAGQGCEQQHQTRAEQHHEEEISCATAKGTFLQTAAVLHEKKHVEQKLQTEFRAEEEEIREQTPYLQQNK